MKSATAKLESNIETSESIEDVRSSGAQKGHASVATQLITTHRMLLSRERQVRADVKWKDVGGDVSAEQASFFRALVKKTILTAFKVKP